MAKRWKEVVRLALKGPRFADNAIELAALTDILRYQELVTTTATELWWVDNPNAGRLPDNFKQSLTLRLKAIEPGSAVLPIEALVEEEEAPALPGIENPLSPVQEAVHIIAATMECVENERSLPERFPKSVIPLLADWAKDLEESGSVVEITPTGGRPVAYTKPVRERLLDLVERKYEDTVDIIGTVLAVDVKRGRFVIYQNPEDPKGIEVTAFASEQEDLVTEALKEHRSRRLRVKGQGEFMLPEGKLRAITHVDELIPLPTGEIPYDPNERPIWEEILEIAQTIPAEELAKLPPDLSVNLDHYLYGSPKR